MLARSNATLLSLTIATSAVLAGCGHTADSEPGLKPGAEGITAVIQTYARAVGNGDGPRACSLMSAAAQKALIQRASVSGNCLAAVKAIAKPLGNDAVTALQNVDVSGITGEKSTSASATVAPNGPGANEASAALGGTTFHVTVSEARWGIDSINA